MVHGCIPGFVDWLTPQLRRQRTESVAFQRLAVAETARPNLRHGMPRREPISEAFFSLVREPVNVAPFRGLPERRLPSPRDEIGSSRKSRSQKRDIRGFSSARLWTA